MHCARIEREGVARPAAVERVVQVLQLRAHEAPVVQHLLHAAGDAGGVVGAGEIARDDDELAVARTVFEGGEFHGWRLRCRRGIATKLVGRAAVYRGEPRGRRPLHPPCHARCPPRMPPTLRARRGAALALLTAAGGAGCTWPLLGLAPPALGAAQPCRWPTRFITRTIVIAPPPAARADRPPPAPAGQAAATAPGQGGHAPRAAPSAPRAEPAPRPPSSRATPRRAGPRATSSPRQPPTPATATAPDVAAHRRRRCGRQRATAPRRGRTAAAKPRRANARPGDPAGAGLGAPGLRGDGPARARSRMQGVFGELVWLQDGRRVRRPAVAQRSCSRPSAASQHRPHRRRPASSRCAFPTPARPKSPRTSCATRARWCSATTRRA